MDLSNFSPMNMAHLIAIYLQFNKLYVNLYPYNNCIDVVVDVGLATARLAIKYMEIAQYNIPMNACQAVNNLEYTDIRSLLFTIFFLSSLLISFRKIFKDGCLKGYNST